MRTGLPMPVLEPGLGYTNEEKPPRADQATLQLEALLLCNSFTSSSASLPSSPPVVKYDSIGDDHPEPSRIHQAALVSPDPIARLPPPRTPASLKSRDTGSDYYTAVWGSPYDVSPSQFSRSARTAVSELSISEDSHDPLPGPNFGLEHLIPSRLNDLSLLRPIASPLVVPEETFDPLQTPRSRTQRWVQLPQREEESERVHWWSDGSTQSVSGSEHKRPRTSSTADSIRRAEPRRSRPGHNSREANRTLDQQSFWDTLRERRSDSMSSLFESRWAATPEPYPPKAPSVVEQEQNSQGGIDPSRWAEDLESKGSVVDEKPLPGISSSRWADTPEPDPEEQKQQKPLNGVKEEEKPKEAVLSSRWADTPEPEEEAAQQNNKASNGEEPATSSENAQNGTVENKTPLQAVADQVKVVEPKQETDDKTSAANTSKATLTPASTQPTSSAIRLEPPKLRKRVSYRGKNIVIAIPRFDEAAGLRMPMSRAEINARLKHFEDEGYDLRGFDLAHEEVASHVPAQVRDIFPPESETRILATRDQVKVMLPDLEKWKAYENWLTEQKLAALGVTLGGGDDPPPPTETQGMSRQSSGQYPPLPFSPPIPTSSAGSLGRPPMARGHSHTMSVAATGSPLNGPFGHMHRHSTLTGLGNFSQLQQPQQPSPGFPPFSPQQQFALSGLSRVGSPAQVAALRQDLGSMRGPGSPLSQQILTQDPLDYSSRGRQHAYSQSMAQPIVPNAFMSQGSSIRPTPVLPELPEDEDEDEDEAPGTPAYVPPHKRAEINSEIAIPTPRGHRHNISEGLERDLLEAEQRQKAASRDWIEVTEEDDQPAFPPLTRFNGTQNQPSSNPVERDPLGSEHPVTETTHVRKKSAPRLNVAAPAFKFNPGANFQPGATWQPSAGFLPPQSSFTFGAPMPSFNAQSNHNRHHSSGSFNVAAPAFKPAAIQEFKPASSEFSFSSSGPTFSKDSKVPEQTKPDERNIVDELPSIFGKVDIPDIVKPARRSKAIAIVRPEERTPVSTDFEDDEGRVAQGDAKRKQQRKVGDDGDSVPLFAQPASSNAPVMPPPEKILGSNDQRPRSAVEELEAEVDEALEDITEKGEETVDAEIAAAAHKPEPQATHGAVWQAAHGHKHSSSLSALAKPFQPFAPNEIVEKEPHKPYDSISDLEEGEIKEDDSPSVSPVRALGLPAKVPMLAPPVTRPTGLPEYSSSERIAQVEQAEPSFDEIDAVMRQLNAAESEKETEKLASPPRMPSPGSHPMKGVTYLPEQPVDWSRSDAPSPSPRRPLPHNVHGHADSGDHALNGWPQIRQLNKADDAQISDWSGILSPPDEEKLHQRSQFFDSHIDKLIGRIVQQRLQPLEESLRNIHTSVSKRNRSSDLKLQRSSSNVDSDADDEDELSGGEKHRPISRGRDKRVDQIKAIVLEALREQSPQRKQASMDLAELHSVLADMKVSFARAASASLELDDIRAVVEDTLTRQSQALVPAVVDERKETHKRELSDLKEHLNETLAGALEEANQRRAIEEREAESRRQLRLAEEELHLLRESARDDGSRARAMEKEREELVDRLERVEGACRDAEDKLEDSEAAKDALEATLEEYRMSSNKWRQDLDEAKRVREELENTVASAERQNEETQDATGGMRRRLEKLHSDMAVAAGQLASDKAIWKAKEEDYRNKIETLESQRANSHKEQGHLEDELRVMRTSAMEAAESRHSLQHMRGTNHALDEMVRKLQSELAEQQTLTARYERQFHDAQESGRAEVHRTRMSLETEVEAANHQVNLVRADLETEVVKLRNELDNSRMEAETDKARHEHLLEEEETARREALRKVNHSHSVALDEARQKYESALRDLSSQQNRALSHALEDKQRTEGFLNEKLALANERLLHFQDRVVHLEERLEVAKSAAQAAALNAKASKSVPAPVAPSIPRLPEKISPQALRESILVLQEQLQERESRIERLQSQVEDAPAKLKERDTEITWLRELLAVRSEELTDLVDALSKPNFDRAAVRDTAIRIQANLQMEQQEKERFHGGSQTLSGQALANLSSFATPRAASLTSAFNKWRSNMESASLKQAQRTGMPGRSATPSRAQVKPAPPALGYSSGLMTPPATNLRSSPLPDEGNSVPPPRLHPRTESKSSGNSLTEPSRPRSRLASAVSERPTTPLFREQSYDRDAEDNVISMPSFEDDDLEDVADSEPPAFRSLESELEPAQAAEDEEIQEEEVAVE